MAKYTLGDVVDLRVEIDLVNDVWLIHLNGVLAMDESFGAVDVLQAGCEVSTLSSTSPQRVTGAIEQNLTINETVCGAQPCNRLSFESLTPGATYPEGSVFAGDDVIISVGPFTFTPSQPCAGMTTSGFAQVDARLANACRSGNEIEVNNVTLDFDFGGTVSDVLIYYGEYGGTVSLEVNGDCRVVENFPALDGTVMGGVNVIVMDTGGAGGCGVIHLTGDVDELRDWRAGAVDRCLELLPCLPEPPPLRFRRPSPGNDLHGRRQLPRAGTPRTPSCLSFRQGRPA